MLGKQKIALNNLKAKYLDRNSKFITVEDIKIHYRDEGTGPVLFLIHGVCSSLNTWDMWVKELGSYYRIIRIDLPGFGFSSGRDYSNIYDPVKGVEFMDKLIGALGIDKLFLVGNSIGGFVSWRYTLKYPQKVDKLILIDPVGYNQPVPRIVKFASNPFIRPLARRGMPRLFFNIAVRQVFGDQSKLTNEIKERYFELAMYGRNKSAYVEFFTVMRKLCQSKDLSKGINEIKTQTMVMWGTKDKWVPYHYFQKWRKDLKNGTFVDYVGVGHTPMEEIPKQTANDAHKFLMGKSL